jgi:hypothetical protein
MPRIAAGEVARFVDRDHAAAVVWVANLHVAGFDNLKIDVRLPGAKDDVAVGVVAWLRLGLDERQLGAGEKGEGGLFRLSHCVIPGGVRTYAIG